MDKIDIYLKFLNEVTPPLPKSIKVLFGTMAAAGAGLTYWGIKDYLKQKKMFNDNFFKKCISLCENKYKPAKKKRAEYVSSKGYDPWEDDIYNKIDDQLKECCHKCSLDYKKRGQKLKQQVIDMKKNLQKK